MSEKNGDDVGVEAEADAMAVFVGWLVGSSIRSFVVSIFFLYFPNGALSSRIIYTEQF
jgi:hypothetical protein